ncbi:hypothetical protein JAB8_02480 [Janthinobacterium sp. HH106]|nr:hypothetical protein JAB8_02480 [Janthinobacterium sp. HH106]
MSVNKCNKNIRNHGGGKPFICQQLYFASAESKNSPVRINLACNVVISTIVATCGNIAALQHARDPTTGNLEIIPLVVG